MNNITNTNDMSISIQSINLIGKYSVTNKGNKKIITQQVEDEGKKFTITITMDRIDKKTIQNEIEKIAEKMVSLAKIYKLGIKSKSITLTSQNEIKRKGMDGTEKKKEDLVESLGNKFSSLNEKQSASNQPRIEAIKDFVKTYFDSTQQNQYAQVIQKKGKKKPAQTQPRQTVPQPQSTAVERNAVELEKMLRELQQQQQQGIPPQPQPPQRSPMSPQPPQQQQQPQRSSTPPQQQQQPQRPPMPPQPPQQQQPPGVRVID